MAAERVTGPWLSREPETASRGLDYLLDCVRQEECVRDLRFSGLAAGEESLRLLAAAQCRFVNCSFQSCFFEQSSFVDTVFQSCDFSNCDFSDSFFNRCEFKSCKGLGTKFAGSTIKNLTLDGSAALLDGRPFSGPIIYTGAADELFGCKYGRLPYRTLDFRFETHPVDFWQSHGTVNYTVDQDYTRITEFKYLTGQELPGQTTIMKEYSRAYTGAKGEIPYYAIINAGNNALYAKYRAEADRYPNFHLLGRLAEYKYYNMDAIAARALELCDDLLK